MAVQPGEEKVPWKPRSRLPVSEGPQGSRRGTLAGPVAIGRGEMGTIK